MASLLGGAAVVHNIFKPDLVSERMVQLMSMGEGNDDASSAFVC